jgi:ferric-dicitrate binding protein FerR (iron transport regulator)
MRTQKHTPTLPPAAKALAAIDAMLRKYEDENIDLGEDMKLREARDEHRGQDTDPRNAAKVEALKLITEASGKPAPKQTTYQDVFRRREAVKAAIEMLEHQRTQAASRAAWERFEALKPEHDDCWSRICTLLISIERELQEKDRIERKVGGDIPIPGRDFQLLGRLANNNSEIARLLPDAVRLGWLNARDLNDEIKMAREARSE